MERVSSSGVRVSGYVSEVNYTAPTRSRQTVIVNAVAKTAGGTLNKPGPGAFGNDPNSAYTKPGSTITVDVQDGDLVCR